MKHIWALLFIHLFLLPVGCKKTDRSGAGQEATGSSCQPITSLSSAIREAVYIPLGTNRKNLMRDPIKLYEFQGNLYIQDQGGGGIFVFSNEGKFLRYISFPGDGPGEFRRIRDFTLSTLHRQVIILNERNALQFFSFEGVFQKEIKAPFYFERLEALPDGTMAFLHEHNLNEQNPQLAGKKFIHTDSSFHILFAGIDYRPVDAISLSSGNPFFYDPLQKVLLLGNKLHNEVLEYNYRDKILSPWLNLNFGSETLQFEEIEHISDRDTYFRYINLNKKRSFDGNFLVYSNKIWAPFYEVEKGGGAIFDLKGGLLDCYLGTGLQRISPGGQNSSSLLFTIPIGVTEKRDKLIGFIDPEQLSFLTAELKKANIVIPADWPRVKPSDNPILVLFTLERAEDSPN